MIPIARRPLPQTAVDELAFWQAEVLAAKDFRTRVKRADSKYAYRCNDGEATFVEVKATLRAMCHGDTRCVYCEDSGAHQIDHVWPKSSYPERVFEWANYLLSCGRCNHAKLDDFAVFTAFGRRHDVTPRGKVGRTSGPPAGKPLMIDPSLEDPSVLMRLDMTPGLFVFVPTFPIGTNEYARAKYTIDLFGLNSEPFLSSARESAYNLYKNQVELYHRRRIAGAPATDLQTIQRQVSTMSHPTVWRQMQMHYRNYPDLVDLFRAEPAAISW